MALSSRRLSIGWALLLSTALLSVIIAERLPAELAAKVVDLRGDWRVREGAVTDEGALVALDDSDWATVRLPGSLPVTKVGQEHWLRRRVELPEALRGKDLVLVMGETRTSFMRVFVNGVQVGEEGDRLHRLKDETVTLQAFPVPATNATTVVIALHSVSVVTDWTGLHDERFVLGAAEGLLPWVTRVRLFDLSMRTSPVYLGLLLLVLLGALLAIEWDQGDRRRYLHVMAFIATCLLWQMTRTGLLPVDVWARRSLNYYAMLGMALTAYEMTEHHYTGIRGVPTTVNRVMLLLCALLPSVPGASKFIGFLMPYLLLPVGRMLFLAGRSLFRADRGLGSMMDVGIGAIAVASLNDIAGYLGLLHTPALVPLALNFLVLVSAAVVIGDFLGISRANRVLSQSLQRSNLQLDQVNRKLEHNNSELTKALEQAQVAVRVKGEFLAKVSHELRTPLNAIINIPEGLLEDFPLQQRARCTSCGAQVPVDPNLPAPELCEKCSQPAPVIEVVGVTYDGEASRTRSYLETIRRSGKHLLSVVDDVLDFSKLEAGKLRLQPEQLLLQPLLDDLERTLRPIATPRGVTLSFPATGQASLTADPVKLAQIFINLLGNAIKFSPEGGVVSLTHTREAAGHVFSVKDQGMGIAPEHQELIFEGFRQVEGGNTRRFGGTGLGLAITRELVRLHGGSLWLESEVGKGTTFHVRLPAEFTPVLAAPEPSHAAPPPALNRQKVVVVDDEPVVLETLRLALDESRFEFISVTDPREALETIRRASPALVILDVMMPRMSGISLLRDLREDPALRNLPVLVLSAYSSNREVVKGFHAHWLRKPWDRAELDAAMATLLP